ncbi:MAG: anthranilate phosphoribosyltransferase [Lentisphaerae bacterium GWF2_52_8]|nr:MAG: anthranilate phosphoribosyltransferase [Lentisphaerae bacterium GWF2_52_8]
MDKLETALDKLLHFKNLSFEEASSAMEDIMSGTVPPTRLAAFLVALRMKGEAAEEVAGCAAVMRKHARAVECPNPNAVDLVGTGGDGARTFNISTTSAFVAAGAGVMIAKHGNRAVSSRSGSADVLASLGVKLEMPPEKLTECLSSVGMAFLFAPFLHPAMRHAMPVRKELGVRTIFNILGPLSNPAGCRRLVIGVYEPRLCKLVAEAALRLGAEKALVIHGSDGLDEITSTGPTYVSEISDGMVNEYILTPEELRLPLAASSDLIGGTPEENAAVIRDILAGKITGPKRDIVLVNASAAILIAGLAEDWPGAFRLAESSLSSGAAEQKLNALVKFTQK